MSILSTQTIIDGNLLVDALVRPPLFAAGSMYINEALKHDPLSPRCVASLGGARQHCIFALFGGTTCVNRTNML